MTTRPFAKVLASVLDPDQLSEWLAQPVRASRVRLKPDVSITFALADSATAEPVGWARVLWPVSHNKVHKVERWAEPHGLRVGHRELEPGLVLQTGEVAADPSLGPRLVKAAVSGWLRTLEASDAVFRREQLRRLQDEVIELEDVRAGVSITDLGLNDFRMDLLGYIKDNGDLSTAPRGLHAVIPSDPSKGLRPGVIFALRNVAADEQINRGNRLHPHYLVYLDDQGKVIANHTEAKHLLDLLRVGCRPHEEPVPEVVNLFNLATGDGSRMDKYSALLTDAIRSMIETTEERDIDSLFTGGSTTALTQTIAGLDDFELTAFVAVVDPAEGGADG